MKESKFRESDEGGDEDEASWQDSYSDLMTDLLAIFVVLFSFAMMNQAFKADNAAKNQKSDVVAEILLTENSGDENSILSGQEGVLSDDGKFIESINSYIDEEGISNEMSVMAQGDTILLRVAASILFESGKAEISPNAEPLLTKISELFSTYDEYIEIVQIEGHTDTVPTNKRTYETNWELSTSRAVNVLKKIIALSKLDPGKVSAVGYAEFQPIADNDTEDGKAKNRRVDFIIKTINE
jgi:chemotaxis protein MotB